MKKKNNNNNEKGKKLNKEHNIMIYLPPAGVSTPPPPTKPTTVGPLYVYYYIQTGTLSYRITVPTQLYNMYIYIPVTSHNNWKTSQRWKIKWSLYYNAPQERLAHISARGSHGGVFNSLQTCEQEGSGRLISGLFDQRIRHTRKLVTEAKREWYSDTKYIEIIGISHQVYTSQLPGYTSLELNRALQIPKPIYASSKAQNNFVCITYLRTAL